MKRQSKEEALRWLIQAKDEFEDADELRKRDRYYLALFHFQQSAEKALKAYLYYKSPSIQILYTHSIDELIKMTLEFDKEFESVIYAKKLDRYYIITRYPNGLPGSVPSRYFDDPKEAEEAMELAKKVLELVETKMGTASTTIE